ncbi:uncharacterized protein J4E87_004539 [Alternaria ethzedia]|uniref:uncharacterized protein n=1 Tax=Alternaria ethzedia TaxID=181014 RepID=UPI0020C3089F|nr:uncharacterized protein J4E87_004539 [Alternaria ethzedia]KAI4627197.1 hypothetical protein J4E87_004539 [Alternaria ethzedia]
MSFPHCASPLFELPQELLEIVLSYLPPSQDVSNLSRTCKALHAKTVAHLYSNISMEWQVVQATRPLTVADVDVPQALRPNLLLQTILANPAYAQSITALKLQSTELEDLWYSSLVNPRRREPLAKLHPDVASTWTNAKQRLALNAVRDAGLEWHHRERGDPFAVGGCSWYEAILMYDLDATLALLVWICPNLVSLDLGFHIGDDVVYLPEVLWKLSSGDAESQALGCRKLRNVHLGHVHIAEEEQPSDRWTRVRYLHPHLDWRGYWALFWCPDIQKIEMNLMDETAHAGIQEATSLPACSTLTTLRLGESSVKPDTLAKLLSCTPALRRLDYEYWVRDRAFITVDCASLSAALNNVKSSLEHLRFFCQLHSPGSVDVYGKCHFRDYPVLSSLHVSPAVILGGEASLWPRIDEVMPSSLEELCFVDDDLLEFWSPKELIPLLDDFFQGDWRARTPKLQRVYATDNKSWLDAYGTEYLRMLSKENGLKNGE